MKIAPETLGKAGRIVLDLLEAMANSAGRAVENIAAHRVNTIAELDAAEVAILDPGNPMTLADLRAARTWDRTPMRHGVRIDNEGDRDVAMHVVELGRIEVNEKAYEGIAIAQGVMGSLRTIVGIYLSGGLTAPAAFAEGVKIFNRLREFAPKSIPTIDMDRIAQLSEAYDRAKNPVINTVTETNGEPTETPKE